MSIPPPLCGSLPYFRPASHFSRAPTFHEFPPQAHIQAHTLTQRNTHTHARAHFQLTRPTLRGTSYRTEMQKEKTPFQNGRCSVIMAGGRGTPIIPRAQGKEGV